jgi:hypothetical protein
MLSRQGPRARAGLEHSRLHVRHAEGIGRVEHVHCLAETPLINDDHAARLWCKNHRVDAPEPIHHEVFHPPAGVSEELAHASHHTCPGQDLIQAAPRIAARPDGAVRRHRHSKETCHPGADKGFHYPLTLQAQPITMAEPHFLPTAPAQPHAQRLGHCRLGRGEEPVKLHPINH